MRTPTIRTLGTLALLAAASLAPASLATAPLVAQAGQAAVPQMFRPADVCMACHNGLTTPLGEDISFGTDWRPSIMANSARDPYWQAAVRRETLDHPSVAGAIQDECSKCHMPMMRFQAHAMGGEGQVFANAPAAPVPGQGQMAVLAADGVSCTMCHQIQPEGLGEEETFTGGFHVDTQTPLGQRPVFGPYPIPPGLLRTMQTSAFYTPTQATHIQQAGLCASCHTLYTHARNEQGEVIGELPEQVPYLEWLHSDYPGERACQSCHMPVVEQPTPIASVAAPAQPNVSRHVFRGGNFFMPRVFNLYRDELGVRALPIELDLLATRTRENLSTSTARLAVADLAVDGDRLTFGVDLTNLTGHKLPTAYPSRRAWLHVSVVDAQGRTVFESGALRPDGSIVGNDNDADASSYEPHYTEIRSPEEVQIFEAIMVDGDDQVTTGLIKAVRFVKDNRLLPTGFDKATAGPDIAVHGRAAGDEDFTSGVDRVRYGVDLAGAPRPLEVRAELWYQPIAFRWAHNLAGRNSMETDRFVRYYESLSEISAHKVADVVREVP